MQTINQRLKELRGQLGMTQREVSAYLKVKPSYYSDLENGHRTITGKFIEKLNKSFGVSADWMYTGIGDIATLKSNLLLYPKNVPHFVPLPDGTSSQEEIQFQRGRAKKRIDKMRNQINPIQNEVFSTGYLSGLAAEKGLGGENKAIFSTYKILEKLYADASKPMQTEDLAEMLLKETEKWSDKSLNYYLRSTRDTKNERPELGELRRLVENVLVDVNSLQAISKNYLDSVLNANIEFSDYESFKANRIANFEKLIPYKEALKPLAEALEKFIKDFAQFDDKKVIKED